MARSETGPRPQSRINRSVCFKPPRDVAAKGGGPSYGRVVEEVWGEPVPGTAEDPGADSAHHWGEYCFFSQLIKWDNGKTSIRLGYFRRRKGERHWEFAGQQTINSDPRTIESLLRKTLEQKSWFER